jgi:hypothetical protein
MSMVTTAPSSTMATGKCPIAKCGQTRIADGCSRQLCRKHCVGMGGCALKKHKADVNAVSPIPHFFAPNLLAPAPPAPPSFVPSAPQPSPPSSAPLPLPTPVQSNEAVDARPDPRYASHLCPIFAQQIAEQQEKSRQQSLLEAERKEKTQKAKQRVTVYSWMARPTIPLQVSRLLRISSGLISLSPPLSLPALAFQKPV